MKVKLVFRLIVFILLIFTVGCSNNIPEEKTDSENLAVIPEGKARLSLSVSAASNRTIMPETPSLEQMTYRLFGKKVDSGKAYEDFENDSFLGSSTTSWQRSYDYYHNGSYSLVSPYSTDNSYTITVDNCSGISFYYRNYLYSSSYGSVNFYIDGVLEQTWNYSSYPSSWDSYSEEFLPGSHTFTWEYIKGNSSDSSYRFYLDDISFFTENFESFESSSFLGEASLGEASYWNRSSDYAHNGSYSLVSPYSTDNSYTITVDNCSGISFYYRNYLRYYNCSVEFYIDDHLEQTWQSGSSSSSWYSYSKTLSQGKHTFTWKYIKGSYSDSSYRFYLDDISFDNYPIVADSLTYSNGKLSNNGGDIVVDSGDWYFTLIASKGDEDIFYAKKTSSVSIQEGETTSISFYLQSVDSGNGDLSVTVNLPSDIEVERVEATLLDSSYQSLSAYEYEDLTINENASEDNEETAKSVTYAITDIPSGNYFVKFKFYYKDGTEIAPGYSETVIVKPNMTSTKTHDVLLEKRYAINYHHKVVDGSTFKDMPEAHAKRVEYPSDTKFSFTEYESAMVSGPGSSLGEPSCIGYVLKDVFKDSNCNIRFEPYNINKGTKNDIDVYVQWTANPVGTSASLPDAYEDISVEVKKGEETITGDFISITNGEAVTITVSDIHSCACYVDSYTKSGSTSGTSITFTISLSDYSAGLHEILILAQKESGGEYYSKTYTLAVTK